MKYKANTFTRNINGEKERYYCIEYNNTNKDFDEDWYELEDFTEAMCKDIAQLLNTKYSEKPLHSYSY